MRSKQGHFQLVDIVSTMTPLTKMVGRSSAPRQGSVQEGLSYQLGGCPLHILRFAAATERPIESPRAPAQDGFAGIWKNPKPSIR
jgi:hypothetical protein